MLLTLSAGNVKAVWNETMLNTKVFSMENVIPFRKDNLYETFFDWGRDFSIEFSFKYIKEYKENWLNLFHFTTGGNHDDHSSRIPALFIRNSNELILSSGTTGDDNYVIDLGTVPLGVWQNVVIEQREAFLRVWINSLEVFANQNSIARNFHIVHLYLSNPWIESFGYHGEMINFKVSY